MGASVTASMALLLFFVLSAPSFNFVSLCSGADQRVGAGRCISKERQALLDLKEGFTDLSNRLSSWSLNQSPDCCQWAGVRCDNLTGTVTELHLRGNPDAETNGIYNPLGGDISPSLVQLESLSYLDLSNNDFQGTLIPSFLGSMTSLRYLNLSSASFGGLIPSQLQNLSSIRYLDLGRSYYGLRADSLGWIGRLRTLEYLDMSWVDLHGIEADWPQVVSMLPSLSKLLFQDCELEYMVPPRTRHVNFSSLQVLDLSSNRLSSRIPNWLFNLTSIRRLDLSHNSLYGEISETMTTLRMLNYLHLSGNSLTGLIPSGIGQLKHLEVLNLEANKLNGSVPWSIGNLTCLRLLGLSFNQLDGTIPESTGLLSNLEVLHMDLNRMLGGTISETHLSGLSRLKVISFYRTSLSLRVNPSWTPPFQLLYIDTSFSKIGPDFPSWLRSQTSLYFMDMTMTGISDSAPDWFWEIASGIQTIKLAHNQIEGDLTHVLFNSTYVDIKSNCFRGQLPRLSSNVRALNVGNNTISGHISTFICGESNRNNSLELLDISMNNLSGELPDCWMHWQSLTHLNLGNNNLSSKIPVSIGSLYKLIALQLDNNRLFGGIPSSLKNCTSLYFINLGENELNGLIPNWIGEMETRLVLSLRSNKFSGHIPVQLCQLSSIMVLDLSNNNLSGTLPKCLSNFYSMADGSTDPSCYDLPSFEYEYFYGWFPQSLDLVTKGTESTYQNTLPLVRLIDFSNNMLSGTIPTDISRLAGLHFLNLSHNHLVGAIPKKIGDMTNLESLDLSRNQLSGEIPASMSKLSFLSYLDLSYNNLSGEIPLSTQLQTLNESSFLGNVGLCGAPLSKHCKNDTHQVPTTFTKEDVQEPDKDDMFWFYIGVGPGFASAFVGVCATLYFNTAWRQALFQFLEDLMNQVYVLALLMVNQIKRRIKKRSDVSVA